MLGHTLPALADRIAMQNAASIMRPAFTVIERVQGMDPAAQVTGSAVAVCAMAQELGLDMRELIRVAERVLADSEGPFTEHIQAIRAYTRGELLRS